MNILSSLSKMSLVSFSSLSSVLASFQDSSRNEENRSRHENSRLFLRNELGKTWTDGFGLGRFAFARTPYTSVLGHQISFRKVFKYQPLEQILWSRKTVFRLVRVCRWMWVLWGKWHHLSELDWPQLRWAVARISIRRVLLICPGQRTRDFHRIWMGQDGETFIPDANTTLSVF